jgi:hypothetical protein
MLRIHMKEDQVKALVILSQGDLKIKVQTTFIRQEKMIVVIMVELEIGMKRSF